MIIGGGTGGLVSAFIAAQIGARVALIERGRTGGDCLWTGCVPSKTLIATAAAAHTIRTADQLGLSATDPVVDFPSVMRRVRDVIATIEPQDSVERLRDAGIEVIPAVGRFTGPHRIRAGERDLHWRTAIIATGSEPVLPELDGLEDADPMSTETVWQLDDLPQRLLVLGGGPVGCELAQAFGRLGAQVTIVEMAPRLLLKEEPRASQLIRERLEHEGITVRLNAHPRRVTGGAGGHRLEFEDNDETVMFDRVLIATGRRPRTHDLGLQSVGVDTDERGNVQVDSRLQTTAKSVYAVGDVTGAYPFTHVAAHHARVATPNALFHMRSQVAKVVPWTTFTDPEVAHVGLTEAQARERWGERTQLAHSDYGKLDRAITAGQAYGFALLIGDPHGRLVGATVCAPAAGEAIAELTAWISQHSHIQDVSRTIHAYPTFAEGPARAADEHLTARLLASPAAKLTRPVLGLLRCLEKTR